MASSDAAKEQMLGALTVNQIRLHSDDPGVNGVLNPITNATAACTLGSASGNSRSVNPVSNIPVEAGSTVAWFSLWDGGTFKLAKDFTGQEVYTNAGVANVTSLSITLNDVA
jgi:hypothetical protein